MWLTAKFQTLFKKINKIKDDKCELVLCTNENDGSTWDSYPASQFFKSLLLVVSSKNKHDNMKYNLIGSFFYFNPPVMYNYISRYYSKYWKTLYTNITYKNYALKLMLNFNNEQTVLMTSVQCPIII